MNHDYLDTSPTPYLTGDYDDTEPDVNTLTEVYIVLYTLERKGQEPKEIYSFTTIFSQAYKRFKMLPNSTAFLKRVLTDNQALIKLAKDGTKPEADNSIPEELHHDELASVMERLTHDEEYIKNDPPNED